VLASPATDAVAGRTSGARGSGGSLLGDKDDALSDLLS
jgi:hypothetical protein